MTIQRQGEDREDGGRGRIPETAVADRTDRQGRQRSPRAGGSIAGRCVAGTRHGAGPVALRPLSPGRAGEVRRRYWPFVWAFFWAKANASNSFVNFIYDVSKPLASPFQDSPTAATSNVASAISLRHRCILVADRRPVCGYSRPFGDRGIGSYQSHAERADHSIDERHLYPWKGAACMSIYGNTCPMCCGDIDSDRAVVVCPSWLQRGRFDARSRASQTRSHPDVSAMTDCLEAQESQMQPSASGSMDCQLVNHRAYDVKFRSEKEISVMLVLI